MGFHLRKSFKCGPFRFNLSNSGIGVSAGVKGLRVGIDGKGRSYVGGGVGMLRYRKYSSLNKSHFCSLDSSTDKFPEELKEKIPFGLRIFLFVLFLPIAAIFIFCGISLFFVEYSWAAAILGITFIFLAILIPYKLLFDKKIKFKKYIKLACNDFEENNYEQTISNFLKAKDYKPQNIGLDSTYYISEMIFNCYVNLEQYENALDFVKKSIIQNSRQKIVKCYFEMGKWNDLVNYIQSEFTSNERSENPVILALLANAFLELGQNEIALETMLTGPIRKRNMDLQMCAFRYTLGECYEANNDIKNALKQYQKVYSFDTTYENVKEKINNLTKE